MPKRKLDTVAVIDETEESSKKARIESPTPEETELRSKTKKKTIVKEAKEREVKPQFPTHFECEKSLVQVYTTSQEANYDQPWTGTSISSCTGSGLVISHGDKKYVLTNAHCVENSAFIRVRLANDRKKKYEAKRKSVGYQCDLALLEVTDPDFLAKANPVELGQMVRTEEHVLVAGFPMGGMEISVADGIVSRIEVDEYAMSGLDMLQVMVSAPINPGNSGGPIFSTDYRVVGIAFQGIDRAGLGYMIPVPIIEHFLKETFSDKPQKFPILPITYQSLENPALRKSYHMSPEQSGVRIKSVDDLTDAFSKLKTNDILLEIDGLQVSNEGTVDIPGVGNCINFCHVTHMKYIGDTVNLKVLRHNPESKEAAQILNISVILDHAPRETEKVPQTEHDKMPTYYVNAGISFIPLTRNYLEGRGSELNECYFVEESSFLAEVPKKAADEQIIVINDILDCPETDGYEENTNAIVKEINGKRIRNIHDVVAAMEANKEEFHIINTASKNRIVIKNMNKAENEALLKLYNINNDRSEDLRPATIARVEEKSDEILHLPVAITRPAKEKPLKLEVVSSTSSGLISNALSAAKETTRKPSERKKEEKSHELTRDMMPGLNKYLNKITELEQRYKDAPVDEDSDEEDSDYEAPTHAGNESDVEDDAIQAEEAEEADEAEDIAEAKAEQAFAARSSRQSGLYHLFGKKKSEEVNEEVAVSKHKYFGR